MACANTAVNSEGCIAGILSNVSASTSVLAATMAVLSTTRERHPCEDESVAYLAAAESAVSLGGLADCPKQGTSAAVCHCAAMDARQGIWTLASARENGQSVLMAIKGTLSKQTMLLERMCIYRMVIPAAFSQALTASVQSVLLPPTFPGKVPCLQASLDEMKKSGARLDDWYNAVDELAVDEIFSPNVAIIRHVTDTATGARTTACMGIDDLKRQQPNTFGSRKKHLLSEIHDPAHCVSYVQSYEISIDDQKRTWRQSSMRIRVYDPSRGYKLALGVIFFSERDLLQNRVLGYKAANGSSQQQAAASAGAQPAVAAERCNSGSPSAPSSKERGSTAAAAAAATTAASTLRQASGGARQPAKAPVAKVPSKRMASATAPVAAGAPVAKKACEAVVR